MYSITCRNQFKITCIGRHANPSQREAAAKDGGPEAAVARMLSSMQQPHVKAPAKPVTPDTEQVRTGVRPLTRATRTRVVRAADTPSSIVRRCYDAQGNARAAVIISHEGTNRVGFLPGTHEGQY